jgi:cation diffusion facilitator CzcD-associated flavoprotein CzcO
MNLRLRAITSLRRKSSSQRVRSRPLVCAFSKALSAGIFQVHSSNYRNPVQLPPDENALVVGSANSGAQIVLELARHRRTYLATGNMPVYSSRQWLLDTIWAWRVHKVRATYIKRRINWPWPFGTTQGFFVGDFFRKARERQLVLLPRVIEAAGDEVRLLTAKSSGQAGLSGRLDTAPIILG